MNLVRTIDTALIGLGNVNRNFLRILEIKRDELAHRYGLALRIVGVADSSGVAVNPDIVRAQMESGIVFGLSAALYGEISLKDGVVQQSNFHDYPLLRMNEMPRIEVHIVPSGEKPTGVGEPAVPPIAPAVANALFAATGKEFNRLPLRFSA